MELIVDVVGRHGVLLGRQTEVVHLGAEVFIEGTLVGEDGLSLVLVCDGVLLTVAVGTRVEGCHHWHLGMNAG